MKNSPVSTAIPVDPLFMSSRVNEYYTERVEKTWKGGHIMRGRMPGQNAIRLVTNDYLGMSNNPAIKRAQIKALNAGGPNVLMSAVYLHGENPQSALEARFARYMNAGDTLISQSGYNANTGLIESMMPEDHPVYIDMFAHKSLWDGIRSAGAVARPFRHNSPEHLASQIAMHGPGMVVVDSVYSTTGVVCPLDEVVNLAYDAGCIVVVDESHSLGTHGPEGAGLVVELGLEHKVHFRTASLAKAFGGRAGIIACSARNTEFLRFTSSPAIFSSALLPHEIAALDATLTEIQAADAGRSCLRRNTVFLRSGLSDLGYNVDEGSAQIIALEAGSEESTIVLRDALERRGVFGSVFCAPATPKNRSLIRFSLASDLTIDQLSRVLTVCEQIREEVDLANWPSTQRLRRAAPTRPVTRAPFNGPSRSIAPRVVNG